MDLRRLGVKVLNHMVLFSPIVATIVFLAVSVSLDRCFLTLRQETFYTTIGILRALMFTRMLGDSLLAALLDRRLRKVALNLAREENRPVAIVSSPSRASGAADNAVETGRISGRRATAEPLEMEVHRGSGQREENRQRKRSVTPELLTESAETTTEM